MLSLGSIRCRAPSREVFNAWLSVVDGLVRSLGTEELMKHAMSILSGENMKRQGMNEVVRTYVSKIT
ncbi:hypothetical protein JCM16161A_23130 [Vulcanisaeta sp. JCM 16161]|uniref:hypothetical protein n=1 Tax=Vulcanisaeta sp. JCM 16161 TaxID=1295372 RepID=UPI0006D06295|nr:hypothetical protein [Vulcanisaeta sp. JCM 16161]